MVSLVPTRDYVDAAFSNVFFHYRGWLSFTIIPAVGIAWYLRRNRSPSPTITIIDPPTMRVTIKGVVDTSSTEEGVWRRKIQESSSNLRKLVRKSLSPLSKTPYRPKNDPDKETSFEGLVSDLKSMGFKDVETLLTMFVAEAEGVQDDKKLLLENMIRLLSKLNPEEKISRQLTGGFINNLYNALPHPALTTLDAKYKYRQADGSFNNLLVPDMVCLSPHRCCLLGFLLLTHRFREKLALHTPEARSQQSSKTLHFQIQARFSTV